MILTDTVTLDASSVRMTRDGYLVADARIARTGVQQYRAGELGLTDRDPGDLIRVYRPESAVFDDAAMKSLAHRPLTNDHPTENVTAANWKRLAIGATGDDVVRDGDFVRVPLTMMDQDAIDDWKSGKRQLSVGYSCNLEMKDGVTEGGEAYDAVQSDISGNHIALCHQARGGPQLRIGDSKVPDLKTLTFDGVPIADVSPAAEAVILKLQGQVATVTTAKDAASADVVRLTAEAVAKDAEIVTLKAAAEAGKITPAKLRDAAKAYATVIAKAKALGATVTDEMDEIAVKKAVVAAKMGDAAKGYTDEHVGIAFDTLTAGVKIGDTASDPIASLIGDGVKSVGDAAALADKAYNDSRAAMRDAWKTPAATH